jgi:hypothetical protein
MVTRFPFVSLAAKQVDLNSVGAPRDQQPLPSLRIRFTLDHHQGTRSRSLAPCVLTTALRRPPKEAQHIPIL